MLAAIVEDYNIVDLPVHNDWSPQDMSQTEDMELLQTLPWLTG